MELSRHDVIVMPDVLYLYQWRAYIDREVHWEFEATFGQKRSSVWEWQAGSGLFVLWQIQFMADEAGTVAGWWAPAAVRHTSDRYYGNMHITRQWKNKKYKIYMIRAEHLETLRKMSLCTETAATMYILHDWLSLCVWNRNWSARLMDPPPLKT